MILWSVVALVIIAVDQLSKYMVVQNIGLTDCIEIIPDIINFVYVKNTGAAFSFLSQKDYGIVLLSIVSVLFCIGVIAYAIYFKPQNKLLRLSLSLMFAGAVGNVIDRILRGFVVDFIELDFINFPVFNFADIAITSGAVLLIIYVLFFDRGEK